MGDRVTAGESKAEMQAAIAEMQGRLRGFQDDLATMSRPSGRGGVAPRRAPRGPAGDPLAETAAKVAAAQAAEAPARAAVPPERPSARAPGPPSAASTAPARRPPRRPAPQDDPLAFARRTIGAAEEEVRGVLADAREQLAGIAARTREALERVPVAPAATRSAAAAASGWADDHVYVGTVSVACGPFASVAQLSAFERALESVEGVGEVFTRSFEGSDVLFEVTFARPTVLLRQLKRLVEAPLTVVEGGGRHVRLQLAGSADT
jgi:hypothetical protein